MKCMMINQATGHGLILTTIEVTSLRLAEAAIHDLKENDV